MSPRQRMKHPTGCMANANSKYMILYQKTEDPLVIVTDSKTKDVQTKKLTGIYFRIIPPANDRVNWVLTCSEMHVDRWASATDSTMIISENLRKQLVSLFSC
jgi:hypothetical protein